MNTIYRYCEIHPRGNWRPGEYQCSEGRQKREFCREGRDESQPTSSAIALQKRLRAQHERGHRWIYRDELEREQDLIDLHEHQAKEGRL